MTNVLAKLFEHNNWANLQILRACTALGDEELDAKPRPGTEWSLRETVVHLVASQQGYLSLLTVPVEARPQADPAFAELETCATTSGEALLALARAEPGGRPEDRLRTTDGYLVEPWVVLLQVINHATEHRRQLSGMLRDAGVTPPKLDGWAYGEVCGALLEIPT